MPRHLPRSFLPVLALLLACDRAERGGAERGPAARDEADAPGPTRPG